MPTMGLMKDLRLPFLLVTAALIAGCGSAARSPLDSFTNAASAAPAVRENGSIVGGWDCGSKSVDYLFDADGTTVTVNQPKPDANDPIERAAVFAYGKYKINGPLVTVQINGMEFALQPSDYRNIPSMLQSGFQPTRKQGNLFVPPDGAAGLVWRTAVQDDKMTLTQVATIDESGAKTAVSGAVALHCSRVSNQVAQGYTTKPPTVVAQSGPDRTSASSTVDAINQGAMIVAQRLESQGDPCSLFGRNLAMLANNNLGGSQQAMKLINSAERMGCDTGLAP